MVSDRDSLRRQSKTNILLTKLEGWNGKIIHNFVSLEIFEEEHYHHLT